MLPTRYGTNLPQFCLPAAGGAGVGAKKESNPSKSCPEAVLPLQ